MTHIMLWTELCPTHNAYAEDLASSCDGYLEMGPLGDN